MTKYNPENNDESFNQNADPKWQWITDEDRQRDYDQIGEYMDEAYRDVRPVELYKEN